MRTAFRMGIICLVCLVSKPISAEPYGKPIPSRDDRYTYLAQITRVIDGDTVEADVDLGFDIWRRKTHYRLNRIDAPEMRGPNKAAGRASTDWLKAQIEGQWLIVRTVATRKGDASAGKFGRFLLEIFKDGRNVNDELVSNGFAVYWDYGKR